MQMLPIRAYAPTLLIDAAVHLLLRRCIGTVPAICKSRYGYRRQE